MAAALSAPAPALPSPFIALGFGAGYAALLVASALGRRKHRARAGLRVVLFTAAAAAACIGAAVLFGRALFDPSPTLVDASVTRVRSGDGVGFVRERVGVFAAAPGTAGISFGRGDVAVDEVPGPARPRGGAGAPAGVATGITVSLDGGAAVRPLGLGRWSGRLLEASGVVTFPVSFTVAPAKGRISVTNDSAAWLRGAVYWDDGLAWRIGDAAPGSTTEAALAEDAAVESRRAGELARLLGSERGAALWNAAGVQPLAGGMLSAWLDEPPLGTSAQGARAAPARPPLSLLVVEAP
jgi:hypothetical protein